MLYPHGYTAGGLCPLQHPVSPPVTLEAETVNDEPVKVSNLLFFIYFVWKYAATFGKLQSFTFGPKQRFY